MNPKNLTVLIFEIIFIFLMIFNIFPREAGLFITGLMIFYFIFSPIEDSLWVFIASIPLFVALPITENLDTLANWRILIIVLFLVLIKTITDKWKLKENLKHYQWEYLIGIFLLIAGLSLFPAVNIWIGIKKIIFLINAFLLYIIIRNLIDKKKEKERAIQKIISAIKVAIGLVLGIGFVQFFSVFFITLSNFWLFWDRHIINVFYGEFLSNLLLHSNTWFSYYASLPATLRMFSVFPDSHSFAFFCILSLPFFLTIIFLNSEKNKKKIIISYILLIFCLLAIIFSGSRGAWVSALGSLLIFLFIIFLYKSNKSCKKQMSLIIGCLIIFFLLFPIASRILLFSQQIQLDRPLDLENISLFERARSIIDFDEISVKSRLEIWRRTVNSIIIHPVLGVGIGNYPVVLNEKMSSAKKGSSAHSLYLDVAAEMGVFALIILLVVFWQILKRSWFIFQEKKEINNRFFQVWSGFFMLALVWILGYSLFDVVLFNDKILLFFIANLSLLYINR
ncbi:O-antigen ligase family protein [Patescibacteria group bacterium]|nr:O-antigen ligase family protein [Patescibacteria group bacterium]